MLAPYALGALLLFVAPAAYSLALALTDADLLTPSRFVGLDNFRELAFDDEIFPGVLWRSALFVLIAVPLRLAVATGLALLLHARVRGARAGRTSAFLPSVVPGRRLGDDLAVPAQPDLRAGELAARAGRDRARLLVLGRQRGVRRDRADARVHGRRGVHRRARRAPGAARRAVRGRPAGGREAVVRAAHGDAAADGAGARAAGRRATSRSACRRRSPRPTC